MTRDPLAAAKQFARAEIDALAAGIITAHNATCHPGKSCEDNDNMACSARHALLCGITADDLDAMAATLEDIANAHPHPDRHRDLLNIAQQLRHGPYRHWEAATEEETAMPDGNISPAEVAGAIANLMRATSPAAPEYAGIRQAYGVALDAAGLCRNTEEER